MSFVDIWHEHFDDLSIALSFSQFSQFFRLVSEKVRSIELRMLARVTKYAENVLELYWEYFGRFIGVMDWALVFVSDQDAH